MLVLLPLQEILLGRADRAVLQPFGVVSREDELHRTEEPLVEHRRLVRQALPDAVAYADPAVLQLQYPYGDAVQVQHHIRPPLMIPGERHLLGNGEIVLLGVTPVDQVNRLRHLPSVDLHRYAVAQQVIDSLIVPVERAAVIRRLRAQLVQGDADLLRPIPPPAQRRREQRFLDIAVPLPVGPVAEIAVAQLIAEQRDDPILRRPLRLTDRIHVCPPPSPFAGFPELFL